MAASSHVLLIRQFRATEDHNLFRIYLVLETFKNEFDIFIRLKVTDQSLLQLQPTYKVPNMKRGLADPWECLVQVGSLECSFI